jgi:hypothetical protein
VAAQDLPYALAAAELGVLLMWWFFGGTQPPDPVILPVTLAIASAFCLAPGTVVNLTREAAGSRPQRHLDITPDKSKDLVFVDYLKERTMAMQARISTIEGDAGKIEDAVKIINEKILPTLKGLEGFTAANFMADRSAGKLVAVAFYQDEAALEGSAEAVKPMRTEVAEAMNGKVVGFESYELVAQSW